MHRQPLSDHKRMLEDLNYPEIHAQNFFKTLDLKLTLSAKLFIEVVR
jgi:hypothetical protein